MMKHRIARLEQIVTYISEHPYSTCAAIAKHFDRRVDLIQSDVRTLYKARLIRRRKVDNSKDKRVGNFGKEYFL